MPVPCLPRQSFLWQPECYDKRGRRLYGVPAHASPSKLVMRLQPKGAEGSQRALPPGMVPPQGAYSSRVGNKPPPTKQRVEAAKATFFHVEGRSWVSKGFAELEKSELERMRASRPRTVEERRIDEDRRREEQRSNTEEAERVRNYFHDIDEERREREREFERERENLAGDAEDEAARMEAKRLQVLHKALNAKYETDERVKDATRAINEAKCSVMWTAQIEERRMLDRMQAEHDRNLERKNNEFNNSKWGSMEQQDQQQLEKRQKFGEAVRRQISDNEKIRYMAAERQRLEAKDVRTAVDEYKRNEAAEVAMSGKRKMEYREELKRYIKLHQDFERMMCEQERLDELRAYDYIIRKEKQLLAQRQEQLAQEAEAKRKRDVLFAAQQKALDAKCNRDELRYLAERERLERRYRDEERQSAEKARRLVESLRQANLEHREHQSQLKACYYVEREREVKEGLKERAEYEKEVQREKEKLLCKKETLRAKVSAQMEEREKARRREREQERLDHERERQAEAQRQKEIDTVIAVKLDDLAKKGCMPDPSMRALSGRVTHTGPKKLIS